ncbi:MAG: type I glyceraldehyde-3-phosphate dehydrogenase [Hyphomicrobiales bacterium]
MTVRVAINGFGRIGRLTLRAWLQSPRLDMEIIAINNRCEAEMAAHLFKYDSVHGPFHGAVSAGQDHIEIDGHPIAYSREDNPRQLPWRALNIDVVMECTGQWRDRKAIAGHLDAGAKKVLVSSPVKDGDLTVVYGVNHHRIEARHGIVSNASCTTNCLAPVAMVLHDLCGIEHGFMTTIHSYTTDQRLLDNSHGTDRRRARAAGLSMIPTSTGAARAMGEVLPALKGRIDGAALRVPTPNVSLIDLVFTPERAVEAQEINAAMNEAANGAFKGVLGICDEALVSIDFTHNPASAVFDVSQTQIVGDRLARIGAWYDNEWGFANRMNDTAAFMGKL